MEAAKRVGGEDRQAWRNSVPLLTPGDGTRRGVLEVAARSWARLAAETQKRIPGWVTELRALERWLALPLPVGAGSRATAAAGDLKLDPSLESLACLRSACQPRRRRRAADKSWLEDRNLAKKHRQSLLVQRRPSCATSRIGSSS